MRAGGYQLKLEKRVSLTGWRAASISIFAIIVALILFSQYDSLFAGIIFFTVIFYIGFTLMITEWRMHYRHQMNALDSSANGRAMPFVRQHPRI